MILIVSYPNNPHVDEVLRHLATEPVVIDTAAFPVSLGVSAGMTRSHEQLDLRLPDGRQVCLCRVGAVWYRRISPYGLHPDLGDPTARLFAWSETNEALLGMWYSLHAFWMNSPVAEEISQRKIRQLQVARRLGLSIPDTLVTNLPDAARAFVEAYGIGRVVRKAFRNIPEAPRETHLLGSEDLALLDTVRYAPVIFQQFVPAALDLRVTVVEHEVFAAAVASDSKHSVDYRPGLATAAVTSYALPASITEKLLALMEALQLSFGAIDLRVTPDGDHVFLEVNPAGEYLFISQRTGQPISAAIAACLERHDRAGAKDCGAPG